MSHEFPVPGWDRYEAIEFIGEGGMGRVYRAHDPRLGRWVAIKIIREGSADVRERFLREARAQARIEHPHVCPIHEVGTVGDYPYIAMHYVQGESLDMASARLTLDQKVALLAQVADAIHAAHRLGIVHRDLKPANIMLEPDAAGGWHPFVTDFGLARDTEADGTTVTGAVLGSPLFMAPEQAKGSLSRVDRRTDVYGLGATLYFLLTGRPPVQGDNVFQVILQLAHEEPVPPRQLDASVPRDLETVVLKCLEKEPQRRYESAQALAADLRRYLDGEPIAAHRASLWYRGAKLIRKHRLVSAVIAAAVVAVLAAGWMAVKARQESARQAVLAQQFGAAAKETEGVLRVAHMLPLHDIRRERTVIRERMAQVRQAMRDAGRLADGPGYYALGRGHLALQEYEAARGALRQGWDAGFRTPDAAYATGLLLGLLYQVEREAADRIPNAELRAARLEEIEREYRLPALEYLRRGAGAQVESPLYVEGLIALYERRYDDALRLVRRGFLQTPWMYELKRLEGDVHLARSSDHVAAGRYEQAEADFQRAGDAYNAASEMAHSDPALYEQIAALYLARANRVLNAADQVYAMVAEGQRACDMAIQADPGRGTAFSLKSEISRLMADVLAAHGQDPMPEIARAAAAAEEGVRRNGTSPAAWVTLGDAFQRQGVFLSYRGEDPAPALRESFRRYEKALEMNPRLFLAHYRLGQSHRLLAEHTLNQGRDPLAELALASRSLERARELAPRAVGLYNTLGNLYALDAEYRSDHDRDPRPPLEKAVAAYQQGLAINPRNTKLLCNLGMAFETRARYEMRHGIDPEPSFRQAIETHRRADAEEPNSAWILNSLGFAGAQLAWDSLQNGRDPAAPLAEALGTLERAHAINPEDSYIVDNLAFACLVQARRDWVRGLPPESALKRAGDLFRRELELNAEERWPYIGLTRWALFVAQRAADAGRDAAAPFQQARQWADRGVARCGGIPELHLLAAEVELARVAWTQRLGRDARAALAEVARRLESDAVRGADGAERLLLLAECRLRQSADAGVGPTVRERLERVEQTLNESAAINSRRTRLGALRAALLSRRAAAAPAGEREALRAESRRLQEEAFRRNPLLRLEVGDLFSGR
jgi:serine/threonine-protein kinase